MEQRNHHINHWLDVFANFRKGGALSEIIKMEESFIKSPYWISPLYHEDYRRYHCFELPGISRSEDFPFDGEGPLWNGICKDDASRKFLFVLAQDDPAVLKGGGGALPEAEREAMARVHRMLNLDSDLDAWFYEYYPLARALTYIALLAPPFGKCTEGGYRAELILLNIVNNYLGAETTPTAWDEFYREMAERMFGARGIPHLLFRVDLEV